MRTLHEADGIAIWLTLFALAWLARFPSASGSREPARGSDSVPSPLVPAGTARGAAT
jgi:hypothetical protein